MDGARGSVSRVGAVPARHTPVARHGPWRREARARAHRGTRSATAETRRTVRPAPTLRNASPLRERKAGQSALLPTDAAARRPEPSGPRDVSLPQTPLESPPRCEESANPTTEGLLSRRVQAAPARDSLAPFDTLRASEGWEGQLEIAVLPEANDALQRRTNRYRHGNTSVVFAGELDGTGVALVKARESWRL